MADGPLHPGGRSAEALGHLGVENLGDRVDDVDVIHGDEDGLPQILIALDVGRYAHLMDDGGYHGLQTVGVVPVLFQGFEGGQLADAGTDRAEPAGLDHVVVGAVGGGQVGNASPDIAGEHQDLGMAFQRQAAQTLQHLQPVQSGQHHLHHDHIREQLLGQFQQLKAVSRLSNDLHVRFVLKGFHQMTAKLLARVRDQQAFDTFHLPLSF